MPIPRQLRSLLHYLLLAAGTLLLGLALLTGLAYYIAVSDQDRVPALVEEICRKNLGAEATFSHYRFQYLEHFPFLSLALEDVVLRDPCFSDHGRELLRIKEMNAVFRPWKMLRREFELKSVTLDTARVQLYRTEDGYFNAAFLEEDSLAALSRRDSTASFSLDKIKLKNIFFDFQDALRGKHFRFQIRHSDIALSSSESGIRMKLRGNWFFHGLYFKVENGPYFRNQECRLALNARWGGPQGGVRLAPSLAVFGQDSLQLEGTLEFGDTSHLRLSIRSRGILLENARPLLADNLQKSLRPFSLTRPAATTVTIDGPLLPGKPQPMEVEFQADSAVLSANTLRFAGSTLRGRYVNNCDSTGPITAHSDCLDIELLSARLFDTIPVEASYHAEDMKAPVATVEGRLEASLPDINAHLPPGGFRFRSGKAEVDFKLSGRMDNPLAASAARPELTLQGTGRVRRAALDYLPRRIQMESINGDFSFDASDLNIHNLELRLGKSPCKARGTIFGFMASLLEEKSRLFASLDVQAPHLAMDSFLDAGAPETRSAGKGGRPGGIPGGLEAEIRVSAGSVTYRKLQASDARFTCRLLNACAESGPGPCIRIDSLSARIFGGIPVRAAIRLDQLDNPRLVLALQLDAPLLEFNPMLPPDKLRLNGGQLKLEMRYEGRLDDYSELGANALRGNWQGTASVTGAGADYLPRHYEFRRLDGAFHFDAQALMIDSLDLLLNGNQARARGRIEGFLPFLFHTEGKLRAVLNLTAPELDLNRFPAGKKGEVHRRGRPSGPARVARALEAALASVEGNLSVKAEKLLFQGMSLDDVAFEGRLLPACEGQDSPNGCARIGRLSARLFGTAPFHATLEVTNLQDPFLVADVQVNMPMKELNRMFAPGQFRFGGGMIAVNFHYEGRPKGHFDVENALLDAKLSGEGHITDGAFAYKPRGYRFEKVNTRFSFDEQDLFIKEIRLLLNDNEMEGNGKFYGFLPFLFLPGRELETSLEVTARTFDLGNFKAPQKFLQPSAGRPQDSTVVTRLVNAGLEKINARLQLRIDSVRYRNFRAANVQGELAMKPGALRFDDTRMDLCDGDFRLSGRIEGLEENRPDIDVRVEFRNTDIRQVFRSFDNFGQQDLTFQNIRGRLDADVRFSARANANYDLLPASMRGQFGVKVQNGALINLPALDSLQNFLLRGRGLSNIQFATLENAFELEGQNLLVDHFFVASTALSFGVEGRYALGEGSDTDLLFEVPVANLFWQGKEVDALEKLHRKKRGPAILLRATEKEEGGLNFKWVLSKGK